MANFHATGRFYQREYPNLEDLVVVQVLKIDDKSGVYVSLLEYDNKEAMINIGEVSKRRIRSLAKLLRVGSTEICMVVSVDEEKGYINLSKKRVAAEDCAPTQDSFAKAKAVHGVMQHVAQSNDIPVEELCSKVSWPLTDKFGHALDMFKKHINSEDDAWQHVDFSGPGLDLSDRKEKLQKDIETVLQRRLLASVLRLQAKCEVSCSAYEGIDAVKAALMQGFKASKEECEVSIKLIAHPVFALSCMCRDKEAGVKVLDEAMAYIQKAIEAAGGSYKEKSRPTFVQKDAEGDGDKKDDGSGSSSGSDSSGEENQDETMGNLDEEQLKALEARAAKDDDEDSD